ncbi:MAG: adenylate cyclase [Chthoniobacter sp.]|jgi:adenylate cyclase|nr:adenylate cyclase [Chthoniobacter sp.]
MPRQGTYSHLLVITAFTLALTWCQLTGSAWLERIELSAQDALMRLGRSAPRDPNLVFLARDTASASLEAATDLEQLFDLSQADADSRHALDLMTHEWPWSREVHALVLERLMSAGARAVVFDFTFPKPSPRDDAFRDSLARHRERVVVAGNIAEDNERQLEGEAAVFGVPTATLIPQTSPADSRIGFDNFWSDLDGIIRQAHYRWAMEHGVWQGGEQWSLASRALQEAGFGGVIPSDRQSHRLRFAGPPGTFPPRSIYEIFVPAYWRQNYNDGSFFRGKIVVIGASGNWQQDQHLTPLGLMPGPELHLNAINAALYGAFLHGVLPLVAALLIVVAAAAAGVMHRRVRRPHARFAVQVLASGLWGGLALLLFNYADLLVPCFAPLLAFNFCGISGMLLDIMIERREKAQLRRTLERYVSRNIVEELVDSPDQLSRALGGDLRQVTILFSDIRDFTRKAQVMKSAELVTQLNEYFSAMVECVFRFGGTLDKFIGDAVMAVWGNARSAGPAADARNAVACALAMLDELGKLNARWAAEGRPIFRIGIGINSGPVVVGNIGSPHRMEFTVIGDAVNVAWRLQERTKGTHNLLLGEAVLPLLGADFSTELCGEIWPSEDVSVAYGRLVDAAPLPDAAHERAVAVSAL